MRNAAIACSVLLLGATACRSTQDPTPADEPTQAPELGELAELESLEAKSTPPAAAPAASFGNAKAIEAAMANAKPFDPASYVQDGFLEQEAENFLLKNQQRQVLVDFYLAKARELAALTEFEQAENQLRLALDLDPQNSTVRQELGEVLALQGKAPGEFDVLEQDLTVRTQLRAQQLKSSALENLERGKLALTRGDYDEAISELSLARDYVRWAEIQIDWEGIDAESEALLRQAREERERALDEQRLATQARTTEMLRAEEDAARAQEQAQIASLLSSGTAAFEAQAYDTARVFADRALKLDPRNEFAMDLRDASFKAGIERDNAEFIRRKRERYREWELELQAYLVPNSDILSLDEDYWRDITEVRQARTAIVGARTIDPLDAALTQQLSEMRLPGLVVEDEESLSAVAAQVRAATGVDIVVDPAAEDAAISEGALFELRLTNAMPVDSVLNLIAGTAGPDVVWNVEDGAVFFTTRERARGKLLVRNHDISDLTLALPNFQAPRLDKLRLFEELEDDDGGGPFGGLDDASTQLESDTLEELVRNNVQPDTWEEDGVSLAVFNDTTMIVRHTPEVQLEVQKFLEDLRRFNSMMVTIDTRFLTVADNYLQEIGVEWRGIDNPGVPFTDLDDVTSGLEDNASLGFDNGGAGVANGNQAGPPSAGFFYDDGEDGDFKGSTSNIFGDALGSALSTIGGFTAQWQILDDAQLSFILRAVEKTSQIEVVNTQTLSVYNSQQAAVSVVNQQAYIQDFDVEVATGITIADPVINVLSEGVSLQVTPTVHHDRRSLTLEVQPTVATVVALTPFATNLANSVGSPVEFVLPELRVESLKTTASIPDGGTILIGGLSKISNIERRAEVPWLANIPLLGFFFKEEGYSDEKESLMILMKAWITDVREAVASIGR